MRTISLKRAKELRQYSKIKKLWRAENPLCKVCWDQGFASTAMNEPHHVKGRFGKRLNDTEYWIPICFRCHNKIHQDTGWAYKKGYLVRR